MLVAWPLVVGKGPDGAKGGGCRLLAATDGVILELVRLAGLRNQLDCDPGAPGIIHVAYHSHLCYT